ncbi:MAG: patatin-like phospholipase family protein [Enhydrobacter sp.]|nr:MAG: patatin-like phospholipase family protein [Enhydrobacter sp.]
MTPPELERGDDEPEKLTPAEIDEFFPVKTQPVPNRTFELGLVLGGTVSAGAYTGGVLDFLVEALDAWQKAQDAGHPDVPRHRVVITTIAGASGGAINGAILLRGAGREFPHGAHADNPFFHTWTEGVDLMKLLSPVGDSAGLASVLNCKPIEDTAEMAIAWNKGSPLGTSTSPAQRSYLADPLRLFMTVGNVTGIPYSLPLEGESGLAHELVAHADYLRFALAVSGGVAQQPASRPDEFALSSASMANWTLVRDAALATSAFPFAFKARRLERALKVTGYRAFAIPDESGAGTTVKQLVPRWKSLPRGESDSDVAPFANVDGGTFNNEPMDLARTAMAGMGSRNPRKADEARRAIVVIDPFTDAEMLSVPDTGKLTAMLGPLLGALIQQPRFKPHDLALADSENVYSRFLVAPVRWGGTAKIVGKAAIASGGLGGFLGFVDAKLLRHDYMLGRVNAYGFLKRHLMMPEDAGNPLFAGWTDDQKNEYRHVDPKTGDKFLPIIPLMKGIAEPKPIDWPAPTDLPPGFSRAVDARLDLIYRKVKQELLTSRFFRFLTDVGLALPWAIFIRPRLRNAIVEALTKGLRAQKL